MFVNPIAHKSHERIVFVGDLFVKHRFLCQRKKLANAFPLWHTEHQQIGTFEL